MKTLEIRTNVPKVNIFGRFEAVAIIPEREVYIDNERVPLFLERVILRGMDEMTIDEVNIVLEEIKASE